MASTHRAPKQWCLTKCETVNSYENWRQNILYTLSLDNHFSPFLATGASWGKHSRAAPLRGFTNDTEAVPEARRLTAQQKVRTLELMLGQIANYCPVISRNSIIKNSTSLDFIWQTIRLHYGFQSTGAHFIDFSDIKLEPDEKPEDLYQRLMAFIEDNLVRRDGGITHHGDTPDEDEELSPSLENFVVLTWLQLINKELPKLVKQRYGTELRSRTLASIKPEISQALTSLIDELHTIEDAKVMRTSAHFNKATGYKRPTSTVEKPQRSRLNKSCPLCKAAGRPASNHYLSECKFLPEQDRKYMLKARQIAHIFDEDSSPERDPQEAFCDTPAQASSSSALRVQVRQSPYLDTFYNHHAVRVTLDSGATGNMIRQSTALMMGVKIKASSQSAHQADGSSPLKVTGETCFTLTRDGMDFIFEGLIVEDLDVEILAGTPFMESNDISIRPARRQIIFSDESHVTYGSTSSYTPQHKVRLTCVLRAPHTPTTIWPGEYIELPVPESYSSEDETYAVEPRTDTRVQSSNLSDSWPTPCVIRSVSGKVRIPNDTRSPQLLKKDEHFCQIQPVFVPKQESDDLTDTNPLSSPTISCNHQKSTRHSSAVQLDRDSMLPPHIRQQFETVLSECDDVFNPNFTGYNGASGPFQAVVNMGPVQPPQRKGRLPQYSRDKLVDLQHKFDELEDLGVFVKPEAVGVQAEYLNPSFLIKKPSGGHRLVTAFADVGRYSKPQPSLMPDVDSTLRHIGKWKYLIKCDLTSAFYQIPLSKDSMKYCGVATPFKGVRIYARSAMGMPGSETALEELLCRVLGDLLEAGIVVKLADDLYCGADTPEELLANWVQLLKTLQHNNLTLSASKTVIAPKSVSLLGWHWGQGTLQASSHRIATLSSCQPPTTVHGLRSFVGSYKVLARVIEGCATFMAPLDNATAGRQSQEKITWSDSLLASFQTAQKALTSAKTITLPRPDDKLWIVSDGAVRKPGIGATLYVSRSDKLYLAGFFSAKLQQNQSTWLPCEIEALSIGLATHHFGPYIIQSKHQCVVLTDSKPCVQAFQKLCRGEFSASPRVSTFLSTVSRYQACVAHIAGKANIPSDFASRNAQECTDPACQVCSFIEEVSDSVVRVVTVPDILNGSQRLPFTTRSSWRSLQQECKDLRRTHAHLTQGTRPSKKQTDIKDIKRYLNHVTISKDDLLVVRRNDPLCPTRECIVVPRQVLCGLLTALHIMLSHPSPFQMKKVIHRYFFALDLDKSIDTVCSQCHQCAALRNTVKTVTEQNSESPPQQLGLVFAADVMRRDRQMIFLLRECVTSYTKACFISDERGPTLRNALLTLCIELRPLDGPPAVVRTDPAPGFVSIANDPLLHQQRIAIEIGRVKNKNKNPVAERAVQELQHELIRLECARGHINETTLSIAVASLNSRLRANGMSAREMLTQRDQFTNTQLHLSDQQIILDQHLRRHTNHPHSERCKAPNGLQPREPALQIGDLVYLHSDKCKHKTRDRYLVVHIDGHWCDIRKFVGNHLRPHSYHVKLSECYKVPSWNDADNNVDTACQQDDDTEDLVNVTPTSPQDPPTMPAEVNITPPPLPDLHSITIPAEINTPLPPDQVPGHGIESAPDLRHDDELSLALSRPSRNRKLPSKFNDYIMDM